MVKLAFMAAVVRCIFVANFILPHQQNLHNSNPAITHTVPLEQAKNWLTKSGKCGYNNRVQSKKCDEEKSTRARPFREPRELERGTEDRGEHGLGAGVPIGRHLRVRPSQR